jgi:hypothetical protein
VDNLDVLAAQAAQRIVRRLVPEGGEAKKAATALDNMATKALGVVQENGIYAGMLFLHSQGNDTYARGLREGLLTMLSAPEMAAFVLAPAPSGTDHGWQVVGEYLASKVCSDLEVLLLVKQVWEQTLTYVRYGAKAREG